MLRLWGGAVRTRARFALAVELKAERCEIYTDVEGIYTADPESVPRRRS